MWAWVLFFFLDSVLIPLTPFLQASGDTASLNSHTNYLLCVLMATDKEVIRMDMQGLQKGEMFHCQDNASSPCLVTNDYSGILG